MIDEDNFTEIWKIVETSYELIAKIGSGKYGQVKKAKDKLSG